ncbi:MAG: amino acid-binding protein [Deltaproteobacteria bacterium]|nr:amino acid-binding protein [Deltaproteobacteria bacterium]MBF0523701.1 amino acid-binding protein [Deltaproteobacteria bacterium]
MKLKQITLSIENSPDRLYQVTSALGDAGINLRALNLVDTGEFGQLRLLVSDVVTARRILMEMQMPAFITEVVATEIPDTPKSLANILRALKDARVYPISMYAFHGSPHGQAVMIFRFSDNDAAIEILREKGVTILDNKAFGMLETGK